MNNSTSPYIVEKLIKTSTVFLISFLCCSCESKICPRFSADAIGLDTITAQQNKYFINSKGDTACFSFAEQITDHKDKSTPTFTTMDECYSGVSFHFLGDSALDSINMELSYYLEPDKHLFLLHLNGKYNIYEFQHINKIDTIIKFNSWRPYSFIDNIFLKKGQIIKLTDTLQQEWNRI